MRTVRRQWNRDPFISARRDGAACLPAVAATWFTARPLRVNFGVAAGMRCGLPLAGAQCCFQFPAQTLGFLFQALDLFAQPLVFLLCSIQLSFRNKLDALRLLVCGGPAHWAHPTLPHPKPRPLSTKTLRWPSSDAA